MSTSNAMTGPEHYRAAEWLLTDSTNNDGSMEGTEIYVAAAQVHATLALAAATALRYGGPGGQVGMPSPEWRAWLATAATDESTERTT